MKATIWHNPRCSKSREALAMLQEAGEYILQPPSREHLAALYRRAGLTPREGMRSGEDAAKPLKQATDDDILDAMVAHPILIERPLVETAKGVVLGRPPEKVRENLRSAHRGGQRRASARRRRHRRLGLDRGQGRRGFAHD